MNRFNAQNSMDSSLIEGAQWKHFQQTELSSIGRSLLLSYFFLLSIFHSSFVLSLFLLQFYPSQKWRLMVFNLSLSLCISKTKEVQRRAISVFRKASQCVNMCVEQSLYRKLNENSSGVKRNAELDSFFLYKASLRVPLIASCCWSSEHEWLLKRFDTECLSLE